MLKGKAMERGDEHGNCDFVDQLEAAVVARRRVYVELNAGGHFVDQIRDVVTENGVDFGVFVARGKVPVSEMHAVADAGPEHDPAPTRSSA